MANNTQTGELAGDLARVLDLLRQLPAFQRPVGGAVARTLDRTFFLTEKATAQALGRKAPIAGPIETRRRLVAPVLEALRSHAGVPCIEALLGDCDADLLPEDAVQAAVDRLEAARQRWASRDGRAAPPAAVDVGLSVEVEIPDDDWLPISEAARRAELTTETVRGWVRRDRDALPTKKVGAVLCVRLADVIAERDAKAVIGNPLNRPRDHRPPSAPKLGESDALRSRKS
jgi:hypothetical protein